MFDDFNHNPANPKQRGNNLLSNIVTNYDELNRPSIEHKIRNLHSEDIDYLEKSESRGIINKIAYYLNLSNPTEWVFLTLFAIVTTSIYISKLINSIPCLL